MKKAKVIIIMPAYNAEKTLRKTYEDIPKKLNKNVILVDDASSDKTVKIAKKLGLEVYIHSNNLGYGGNQKTCYWEALKRNPEIVVMIHPDYQYDATLTSVLIEPIISGRFDIMLGSRIRSRKETMDGGMPLYKYFGNRLLTFIENIILGLNLSEYHTGFRAYRGKVLRKIPFQKFSNDFVFDQQILIVAAKNGYKIGEIPVPVRYFPEASSINFLKSLRYGIETLWNLFSSSINI
jgi:glycosyltransferase involved in cell wall biosynthesis